MKVVFENEIEMPPMRGAKTLELKIALHNLPPYGAVPPVSYRSFLSSQTIAQTICRYSQQSGKKFMQKKANDTIGGVKVYRIDNPDTIKDPDYNVQYSEKIELKDIPHG